MLTCPYDNDPTSPCPMGEAGKDLLFESCPLGNYGSYCAAIISQLIVLGSTGHEGVRSSMDDIYGEIVGYYRPQTISISEAPVEVQNDVLKCRLPVRENRPLIDGGVAIHHVDLTCTLLNNELLAASNWYEDQRRELNTEDTTFDWWIFADADGEIELLQAPKDTVSQYDQSFHPGSAVLHNAVNPPLLVVEILRRRASAVISIAKG